MVTFKAWAFNVLKSRKFWLAVVAIAVSFYEVETGKIPATNFAANVGIIITGLNVAIAIEDHGTKTGTVTEIS